MSNTDESHEDKTTARRVDATKPQPMQQPSAQQPPAQQPPAQPAAFPGYPSVPGAQPQYGQQPPAQQYPSGGYPQASYPLGAQAAQYPSASQQPGYPSTPQPGYQQPAYGSAPAANQQYGSVPPAYNQQPAFGQTPYSSAPQQPSYGQPGTGTPVSSWQAPAGSAIATSARTGGIGRQVAWGIVALAVLALIGVFGSWVKVDMSMGQFGSYHGSINGIGMISGNEGDSSSGDVKDGWFILVFALAALALGVLRALGKIKRVLVWVGVAVGTIGAAVCIYDWTDIAGKADKMKSDANAAAQGLEMSMGAGWGLMLCLVACIGIALASAVSALKE